MPVTKRILQPYHVLLCTALVLLLTAFFIVNQNHAVDIHLHDTYFVIAHTHIVWLLAILALGIWALYLLANKVMYSARLTWLHVIVTALALLLFAAALLWGGSFSNPAPLRYYDYSSWNASDHYSSFTKATGIIILAAVLAQFIFIINFMAGLLHILMRRKA